MLDPSTRDVHDIKHTVTAAASSASADRAREFLNTCNCPSSASAYGSYEDLVKDPNVDVIYVATPRKILPQQLQRLSVAPRNPVICLRSICSEDTRLVVSPPTSKNESLTP